MVDPDHILQGLDPAQREAAQAVRGPVAILAGAGTGKTTTITHRIAYQVATGTFDARALLAVTFTAKAAGELKARLANLNVEGVETRTFHSAALWQLSGLWPRATGEDIPKILDRKAPIITALANSLPPPHKFLPRRELSGEIEWAKNQMVSPERYLDALVELGHEPPIPADLMHRVYRGYEQRKQRSGQLDFEDMLAFAVRMFDDHPETIEEVRGRFHAFTVDEYQDVNPLQEALLNRWLGARQDLCVVGDDYQTIYAFTGAAPHYLLSFPERFPDTHLVRLEENYRSTSQVLDLANRLAPWLGGFEKQLHATRPDGPAPVIRGVATGEDEVSWVVRQAQHLHEKGAVAWEEIAVLYRVNARSEAFEEALASAGVPYQVRDGAFLRRPGPRGVLARLRNQPDAADGLIQAVDAATGALGFDPLATPDSSEEVTLQTDLARMRSLALAYANAREGPTTEPASIAGFVAELATRFAAEESGTGVQLMTYHRSKGLEFDAVFLPRLLDGELPFRSGRSIADVQEERRLLYVGITRARQWLCLSWPRDTRAARSPFITEATGKDDEPVVSTRVVRDPKKRSVVVTPTDGPLFERLRAWRKERSKTDGVPAYVVFPDKTLVAIADAKPSNRADLFTIDGVGPTKLERYADEVLEIVGQ